MAISLNGHCKAGMVTLGEGLTSPTTCGRLDAPDYHFSKDWGETVYQGGHGIAVLDEWNLFPMTLPS